MGTFNQGILGGFRGKVGNVVGFYWKGQAVMRGLAGSVSNPRTTPQQRNRARFAVAGSIVKSFANVIQVSYNEYYRRSSIGKSRSRVNNFMRNAIFATSLPDGTSTAQDVQINPGNLSISEPIGSALFYNPNSLAATAGVEGSNSIVVTWQDNTGATQELAANDYVQIVVWPTERNTETGLMDLPTTFFWAGNATRRDQTTTITLPEVFAGRTVAVYAYSEDTAFTKRSRSTYLGDVVII